MSEIKSQKAKEYLAGLAPEIQGENSTEIIIATTAVIKAETELTESHAKELQEVNNKAVEAHRQCCKHILYLGKDVMSICSANTHNKGCFSDCDYMKSFLTELNK